MQINDRIAEPAEGALVMTRIFDAPRELVFRAWIDPRFMARSKGLHQFGLHAGRTTRWDHSHRHDGT